MERKKRKTEDVEKEIAAINKEIKKKKLRWKAGKTSVSEIPVDKFQNRLGAIIEKDRLKRLLKKQEEKQKKRIGDPLHPSTVDPPSQWDWRDVSGTNWMTKIRNQGGCGSCVAFGVVAVLEMMVKRWIYGDAGVDPDKVDFSEAHLYFDNNRHCMVYPCNSPPDNTCRAPNYGWWISAALNYLKSNYICNEDCFPYNGPNRPCKTCDMVCIMQAPPDPQRTLWNPGEPCNTCNQPCTQALTLCQEWPYDTNFTKIKDWSAITSTDEMKKVLSEHGCLVADFLVYQDFIHYVSGIYEWDGESAFRGGHAVAVVGYDDVDDCWICKNSWGTNWGEAGGGENGGWFRIAYDECGIDDTMYKIDVYCPATESGRAMGLSSNTLHMFRIFRDDLLKTRKGRAYLSVAQKNIGSVTRIFHVLKKDPKLAKEAMNALEPFIKAVKTRDSLRPFKLRADHFKTGIMVLEKIGKRDPKLVIDTTGIIRRVPELVGKTINQILKELI